MKKSNKVHMVTIELEQIIEENLGKDLDHGEGVAND